MTTRHTETQLPFNVRAHTVWGEKVNQDEINFSWPPQEVMQNWESDVSMKSVEFATCQQSGVGLAFVKCTMSNGEESPMIGSDNHTPHNNKVFNFDEMRPVRAVQARDSNCIHRLTFIDGDDNEIDAFNPSYRKHARMGQQHQLADNEELIGFYGVKGKSPNWFTSFGFLIKTKQ